MAAHAGPNDVFVMLDVYPDEVGALIDVERVDDHGEIETERVTPEVLIVSAGAIVKVELLYALPGRPALGFQLDGEDASSPG